MINRELTLLLSFTKNEKAAPGRRFIFNFQVRKIIFSQADVNRSFEVIRLICNNEVNLNVIF